MKTILAHLRKDAVSLRPMLWVWFSCVAFDCLFSLSRLGSWHLGDSQANFAVLAVSAIGLLTGTMVSFGLVMLLLVILIIRVVHADPLTEPDAFWRTRPISRRDLLSAKALFVGLLSLGTVLAGAGIGFSSGNQSPSAMCLDLAVFVCGLVAFAAVTSSFGKLALSFVGFSWGAQILAALLLKARAQLAQFMSTDLSLGQYHAFPGNQGHPAISALYLSGFISVIVWQYLTLKTNGSRLILFVTFLLAGLWAGK